MSWCSRNDTHIFTSVILYINFIFIAQWLPGGNSKQTRVNLFTSKYDVISQLRHSYAKGPFLRGAAQKAYKYLHV